MASDERIERMQADGILSPEQAVLLQRSLDDSAAYRDDAGDVRARQGRAAFLRGAATVIAIALLISFVVSLMMNEPGVAPAPQDVAATLNDPGGIGEMNKSISSVLGIILLLVVPLLIWAWLHNSLVSKEEAVFESWAQTESNLKRRADLIPALVETAARYLKHEADTLTSVTADRSGASLTTALDELLAAQQQSADVAAEGGEMLLESETDLAALFAAQERVGQRMMNFLAVAESYPELRSADQFLELQAQLEGTENRINVARMRFNESVATYNAAIRKMPASLVAGAGGFRRKAYFEAGTEARERPELAFE